MQSNLTPSTQSSYTLNRNQNRIQLSLFRNRNALSVGQLGLQGSSGKISSKNISLKNISTRRSDNTFEGASRLGTYSGGKLNLRINNTLSKTDPVDIYSLTVPSGVTLPNGAYTFKIDRGSIRYSLFGAVPALGITPQFGGRRSLKGSGKLQTIGFQNPYPAALVIYIRFDRPTRNTKYNFRLFS